MSTNTMVIVALAAIAIIIIIYRIVRKSKYSKILNDIALAYNTTVGKHDESPRGLAIGLSDDRKGFVYYKKNQDGTEVKSFIKLSEVSSCSVDQGGRTGSAGYGKIALVFKFEDEKKDAEALVFFDRDEFFQLADELELAEKWEKEINALIKK